MWLLERVVDFGGDRHPLDLFGLPAEYLPCKHSRKQRFQESGGYAQRDATSLLARHGLPAESSVDSCPSRKKWAIFHS